MMNFLALGGRSEVNNQHSYEVDSTFYMVTCKYDEEGRQIIVGLIYKKEREKKYIYIPDRECDRCVIRMSRSYNINPNDRFRAVD